MAGSRKTRGFTEGPRLSNPKSIEMHTNAALFLHDAKYLGEQATASQFVLFVHAIELAIQSFLHGKGYDLKDLRLGFAHDLDDLLKEARGAGLAVSDPDTDSVISYLNKYSRAALRYDFAFAMPLASDVLRVTKALAKDTKPVLSPIT
jgi:hypothetical protein